MRRCSACGYTWPMPSRKPGHGHQTEGIELTPHLQSAARLIGEQVVASAEVDAEVTSALSHCPQCGSGRFTDFRADRPFGSG
jgi:hypothetical protein